MGNLAHESYHYFDERSKPNVTITHFCAVAIPIPENNYSEAGFVSLEYTGENPKTNSDEYIALAVGYATTIIILFIWMYFYNKER